MMRRRPVVALSIIALTSHLASYCWAEESSDPDRLIQRTGNAACDRTSYVIAIDVGHTIDDRGAMSARGVSEYEFNLRLAQRVAKALTDIGFVQTRMLIVRGRGTAQLTERAIRANTLGTSLLLSIHHDSVQSLHLSKWKYLGASRSFSDKFSGHSLFVSLANKFPAESLEFAKLLGSELASANLHFTLHHAEDIRGERRQLVDPRLGIYRYDNLIVLKDTEAPAVLLEAGIIVNRDDEVTLAGAERQFAIARAISNAVVDFCNASARRAR